MPLLVWTSAPLGTGPRGPFPLPGGCGYKSDGARDPDVVLSSCCKIPEVLQRDRSSDPDSGVPDIFHITVGGLHNLHF